MRTTATTRCGSRICRRLPGFTSATVNAGTGNDTIDASNIPATTVKPLTLNGEEGNDTITGGPNGDTISGGEGDDIIIASPGNDTVNGDGGTDQFHVIGRAIADIILANQTANNTLVVTFNGNVRNYTVGTLELVQIDAGLGDDFIGINVIRCDYAGVQPAVQCDWQLAERERPADRER